MPIRRLKWANLFSLSNWHIISSTNHLLALLCVNMILIDNRASSNPYINLAIEEYLVRHADCNGKEYLLMYVNEQCVVVGKNQSIYKEVNFEYLRNGQLKLARRITGGGTVYQDVGNLSFSFISKFEDAKINNYRYFNQPVVNALQKAGVNAEMDARNNILCNGKKISGNAQFTDRKNIISHGTLLLNADLPTLRASLKENDFEIETKAVRSVKSPVMNIAEVSKQFSSTDELKSFLAEELNAKETYHFSEQEWENIQGLVSEKFSTFDWIYGKSPLTTVKKNGIEIEIESGRINKITNNKSQILNVEGMKYEFAELKKNIGLETALLIM
jgi:lipoate-protein ligase A